MRQYEFDWSLIGNIPEGRANLGGEVDLEVYRLMMFTLRDVLENKFGAEETDAAFFAAGKIAGTEFYNHYIQEAASLEEFVAKTQKVLRERRIGVLRIEDVDMDEGRVQLTVDEDLDCSGLPETNNEICVYDEGFISALFECFTHQPWQAKEVDCWCSGARTCRFVVRKMP